MKKLVLVGIGLFMMTGVLPANVQKITSHIECFGTTCGEVACGDYHRELTNEERAYLADVYEQMMCEDTP